MMKLSLLPPLIVLCSDLLFQRPSSMAFPLSQPNSHIEQAASPQRASSRRSFNKIFHPPSSLCVLRKSLKEPLALGPCDQSDYWSYTPQKFLTVKGTYFCLQAVGPFEPARLGIICTEADSMWEPVPGAKSGLRTQLPGGQSLCLDVDSSGAIVTNPCGRASESDSQWFEVITSKGGFHKGNALPVTTPLADAP